uniref:Hypotheticial protein n=1 Tax=Schistosoma japonicum TaxID=6182 RepID=C7TQY0_SCHJA|nr:hypotheticial protein [Schistosoma japonicum]CAX80007.1 hypotheticial protein [Schistosoma japonicum]CAX80008.1 hypotheticial protein [Schistosoma japonicum]
MLFTTLLAILCIHSFVLTYANNSTNSTALNSSIGVASNLNLNNSNDPSVAECLNQYKHRKMIPYPLWERMCSGAVDPPTFNCYLRCDNAINQEKFQICKTRCDTDKLGSYYKRGMSRINRRCLKHFGSKFRFMCKKRVSVHRFYCLLGCGTNMKARHYPACRRNCRRRKYPDVLQCRWDCREHTKYREICDTVCSDDTNKVFATCLFLCDIHHRNGTQTGFDLCKTKCYYLEESKHHNRSN